eukprot:TRINITY_DN16627_c0_g1_i1.p1 TRINITY_DN16627_c0_g1~~TRINITY_DN16627_c0_g1_i1.p1  ORF type:complete len:159 (-),score=23.18 TRINITY_DN16627_c0_g1_i1:106-582(-)
MQRAAEALGNYRQEFEDARPDALREGLEAVFRPVIDGANVLSTSSQATEGALLYIGDAGKGIGRVEVATVNKVVPRRGWKADFLHRADERSQVDVQLCDVAEGGWCQTRRRGSMVLCPCHFICRARFIQEGKHWRLDYETHQRLQSMQSYLRALQEMA